MIEIFLATSPNSKDSKDTAMVPRTSKFGKSEIRMSAKRYTQSALGGEKNGSARYKLCT